tara:strand:+ start:2595 stop:3833 length:1239 start_codon:yes stop_codon:yes gene_type:complete
MPDFVTTTYLILMFIALYFFFFYIFLIIRNKHKIFSYPEPERNYPVTVLIAGYNEEKTIADTVKHVFDSDYQAIKEVIIINDGSTDNTKNIVKKLIKTYPKLKLINNKKNIGKSESLNRGIAVAKGQLIAVIDADSYPEKESIRKLVGFFNDPKVGAATSAVFIRNKQTFLAKIQQIEYIVLAWTRKLLDFIDAVYVTNGPLSMYRKSGLKKVGGFDPNTVTEDIDVTWNLMKHGYKTKMCLSAFVTTTAPSKFKQWWRQRERWGIGGIQAIFKYKKTFMKKGMLGFFVIPFVSLSIILSVGVFLFGMYLLTRKFILTYLSTKYSYISGSPIFRLQDINLHPSILIFFTAVLFVTAFIYSRYILTTLGKQKGEWDEVRNLFKRLFYLLIYLTLYPLIWFSSFYRMIKGDYRW